MLLYKKWPFFLVLNLGNIGQENVLIKTRSSKSRKIEFFPKVIFFVHGFGQKLDIFPTFYFREYCWFSHDVTKTQSKKLSILLRVYFHDALGQLKTNFHRNSRFTRVLDFVIEYD